jgi:hypothetical protein
MGSGIRRVRDKHLDLWRVLRIRYSVGANAR